MNPLSWRPSGAEFSQTSAESQTPPKCSSTRLPRQSGGHLKAKHVEALAALPGPRVDGFFEPLQGPVRGYQDGTEAAALKALLVEPGKAIRRGRIGGERKVPGSVERDHLRGLREGGGDRRHQQGPSVWSHRVRFSKTPHHSGVTHGAEDVKEVVDLRRLTIA